MGFTFSHISRSFLLPAHKVAVPPLGPTPSSIQNKGGRDEELMRAYRLALSFVSGKQEFTQMPPLPSTPPLFTGQTLVTWSFPAARVSGKQRMPQMKSRL